MYKKTIPTILLIIIANFVFAQQIPIQNQFLVNKFAIAPAYAGYSGHTEAFVNYRQNWIGIEGAPKLTTASFNGKIAGNMGYGLSAMTESSGNFSQIYITGAYAYHLKFRDNVSLNFGLAPQLFRNQMDLSKINSYGTQLDPMLQNNSGLAVTAFDVGVSSVFIMNGINIGVSMPRTIGMSFDYKGTDASYELKRHYIAFATWEENITEKIALTPLVLVRTTEKSELNFEVGLIAKMNDRIWGGASYRADNSIVTSVGGAVGDRLVLNYSYEFGIGGLATANSGTHEFTMGFLINRAKKPNNTTAFALPIDESSTDLEYLENQISDLDKKLQVETITRIDEIDRLESIIDSLKINGVTTTNGTTTNGNTSNPNEPAWVVSQISQTISFGQGSSRLFSSCYGELDKYISKMITDRDLNIKIEVHTDNIGSAKYKKTLSDDRAFAISSYLESKGVKRTQIYTSGLGDSKPMTSNTTPEGRRQNNRVVISFNKQIGK